MGCYSHILWETAWCKIKRMGLFFRFVLLRRCAMWIVIYNVQVHMPHSVPRTTWLFVVRVISKSKSMTASSQTPKTVFYWASQKEESGLSAVGNGVVCSSTKRLWWLLFHYAFTRNRAWGCRGQQFKKISRFSPHSKCTFLCFYFRCRHIFSLTMLWLFRFSNDSWRWKVVACCLHFDFFSFHLKISDVEQFFFLRPQVWALNLFLLIKHYTCIAFKLSVKRSD